VDRGTLMAAASREVLGKRESASVKLLADFGTPSHPLHETVICAPQATQVNFYQFLFLPFCC